MRQRLLSIVVMLSLFVGNSMAQRLMVSSVEEIPGGIAINVGIYGATQMSAIQFALELPEGYFFDVKRAFPLGSATSWHRQIVNCIDSGDLQVVIYSMNQTNFSDGTLITIPVTVAENAAEGDGKLYDIYASSVEVASAACDDVAFSTKVKGEGDATDVDMAADDDQQSTDVYDLTGRRVEKMEKGVYIVGGRKVVIK